MLILQTNCPSVYFLYALFHVLYPLVFDICLSRRLATGLPLPAEQAEERPRIDFVVLLIDPNNALRYLQSPSLHQITCILNPKDKIGFFFL